MSNTSGPAADFEKIYRRLLPGEEIEVSRQSDPNDGRAGHVRSQRGTTYQVVFEPGTPDETYQRWQLRPTGRAVDPAKLPPEA